ncbi:MAG: hypothetical protein ABI995_04560 [Acidobacteriota bacterium]
MKYLALLLLVCLPILWAQSKQTDPEDLKLPNGKSWNDAIAKADHEKNLRDARELARLSTEIRDELEDGGSLVLSLKTLKKVEDAEKIVKDLRVRLRRN